MSQKKEKEAEVVLRKAEEEKSKAPVFMTVRTHGKVFKNVPFEPLAEFLKKKYPEEYKD